MHYALDNPTHYRLMFSNFPLCEQRFGSLNQVADASFNVIKDVIISGQKQGLFHPGEAQTIALGAWTQVHGLSLLLLAGRLGIQNEEEIDTMVDALGRTMLRGVAAGADGEELKAGTSPDLS